MRIIKAFECFSLKHVTFSLFLASISTLASFYWGRFDWVYVPPLVILFSSIFWRFRDLSKFETEFVNVVFLIVFLFLFLCGFAIYQFVQHFYAADFIIRAYVPSCVGGGQHIFGFPIAESRVATAKISFVSLYLTSFFEFLSFFALYYMILSLWSERKRFGRRGIKLQRIIRFSFVLLSVFIWGVIWSAVMCVHTHKPLAIGSGFEAFLTILVLSGTYIAIPLMWVAEITKLKS